MTQKSFLKATGVFLERVVWALLMTVVVMVKLAFRVVTNGPASDDNSPRAFGDVGYRASSDGEHWNPNSRDYMPHMDPNRDR